MFDSSLSTKDYSTYELAKILFQQQFVGKNTERVTNYKPNATYSKPTNPVDGLSTGNWLPVNYTKTTPVSDDIHGFHDMVHEYRESFSTFTNTFSNIAMDSFRGDFVLPPKPCKPTQTASRDMGPMAKSTEYVDRFCDGDFEPSDALY